MEFLSEKMHEILAQPELGAIPVERPFARMYLAKWPGAKDGHRIFYREDAQGIFVLRVLHTKMDWMALVATDVSDGT